MNNEPIERIVTAANLARALRYALLDEQPVLPTEIALLAAIDEFLDFREGR